MWDWLTYLYAAVICMIISFVLIQSMYPLTFSAMRPMPWYWWIFLLRLLQCLVGDFYVQDISRCLLWTQRHHQTWPPIRTDALAKPVDLLMLNRLKEAYCQIKVSIFYDYLFITPFKFHGCFVRSCNLGLRVTVIHPVHLFLHGYCCFCWPICETVIASLNFFHLFYPFEFLLIYSTPMLHL